jgi:hypothetical protein
VTQHVTKGHFIALVNKEDSNMIVYFYWNGLIARSSVILLLPNGQNECSSASNYPRKTRSIDIYECDFSEFGTQYSCNNE